MSSRVSQVWFGLQGFSVRRASGLQHPLRGPQWTEAALRPHRRHHRSCSDRRHRGRGHVLHQVLTHAHTGYDVLCWLQSATPPLVVTRSHTLNLHLFHRELSNTCQRLRQQIVVTRPLTKTLTRGTCPSCWRVLPVVSCRRCNKTKRGRRQKQHLGHFPSGTSSRMM